MVDTETKGVEAQLLALLDDRPSTHDHFTGQPVGIIGQGAPWALMLAAKGNPVLLNGRGIEAGSQVDLWLGTDLDGPRRGLFELLLSGELNDLMLLVFTRGEEQLYYYIKEAIRRGHLKDAPPVHMYDAVPHADPAFREYNAMQFDSLEARLSREYGAKPDETDFAEAIEQENLARNLQRLVLDHRLRGALPGIIGLPLLALRHRMMVDDYSGLTRTMLSMFVENGAGSSGRTSLLLASHADLLSSGLHQQVEEAGAHVAMEFDPVGAWGVRDDIAVTAAARDAVLEEACTGAVTHNMEPASYREQWLHDAVARPEIDAVLLHVSDDDDRFGWRVPALERTLGASGKAVVVAHGPPDAQTVAQAMEVVEARRHAKEVH